MINYEQKYKESMLIAEHHVMNGALSQDEAEALFPELCESEDERIRKEAISIVQSYMNICDKEGDPCLSGHKVIAWLEKQKDASEAIEAVERIDKYITEHTANSWEMDDSNPDKKYYCGVDDTLSNIAGILQGIYAKQKEQKPAEKQDYSGLNDLERAIHRGFLAAGVENVPVGIIKETAKECLAQMKPAEWSEEDEKMVQFWNMYYEHKVGDWPHKDVVEHLERFKEWLNNRFKSLRPEPKGKWAKRLEEAQARWKPSEKKVEPLKNVPPIESIMK
jgi:hypothetical protein